MARLIANIKEALEDFYLEKESYFMMYLMASGLVVNATAVLYVLYWLFKHVRFV